MKRLLIIAICILFAGCAAKTQMPTGESSEWDCKSHGGLLDLGRKCTEVTRAPAETYMAEEPLEISSSAPANTAEIAEPEAAEAAITENGSATASEPTLEETPPIASTELDAPLSVEEQMMAVSPNHYAVQIVSMSTEANLQHFINEHKLFEKTHVRTHAKGQIWYVVIFGVYEHYSEAKRVLESIPYRYQTQAWIRPVASLQEAMREYQRRQ